MRDTSPKLFAVGDIHGQAQRLARLLGRLPLDPGADSVVFLGDYLNRGPQSRDVLDLLLDLEGRCPRAVFLEGNHERALLEYAHSGATGDLQLLRAMGVEATLDSYGAPVSGLRDLGFLPPEHLDFLLRLRPYHRQDGYLFVHAGLLAGEDPESTPPERMQNARGLFLDSDAAREETVVFGHTAFATPLLAPGRIGVDTGSAYGGMLTALELPALLFHHA
jgi:serine/threonine protein phosphatase 1